MGETADWATITPPSMEIVAAASYPNGVYMDPSAIDGYTAKFLWAGGGQAIVPTSGGYGSGIGRYLGPSRYFGWQVTCSHPTQGTCGDPNSILAVRGIQLAATDNTPPALSAVGPDNVFSATGWIRGAGWSASFAAGDDSGVCGMGVTIDGTAIPGPADATRNTHSWTQCWANQTDTVGVDTTRYPDGPVPLVAWASDAANPANQASAPTTMHIDNQPVALTLGGPTAALSTSGTQYLTATASAGPSGVGIDCSLDGAPYGWYAGPSESFPVSGLGTHTLSCFAQNDAVDVYGTPARSATETWTLSIRQPAVIAMGFRKVVNALRCRRVSERVHVPAHWVKVWRKHHWVHVHVRAHVKRVTVTRCHPRTVWRRIVVWKVVKHGHHKVHIKTYRWVHKVLLPRWVDEQVKRIAFGSRTVVSGWLGTLLTTASGNALAGQPVEILTAADNGDGAFVPAAWTTSRLDGSWHATLPAGPSRLVVAEYPGNSVIAPAGSALVRLIVPARVRISIHPRSVSWGGRIRISGRLAGGYVPSSGELVVLYIGWPGGHTEIGHLYTDSHGRFSAPYTFLRGNGTERYRIWAASAKESDYPYSPASSPPVTITVSQR